jgi:cytochrome c oxidase cbb3-type subunit III
MMPAARRVFLLACVAAAALAAAAAPAQETRPGGPAGIAREERNLPPIHSLGGQPGEQQSVAPATGGTAALINTPVSNQFPGGISTRPKLKNPVGNDPAAAQRGMAYFNAFNCVGCHAANAGGGMGPALSNRFFQYGGAPANIYLSIVQGRPNGMPAWGAVLPDNVVWDLVAYIEQISKAPKSGWGTTISPKSPSIEQVPAEYQNTPNPWAYTEPFSYGQKPSGGQGRK